MSIDRRDPTLRRDLCRPRSRRRPGRLDGAGASSVAHECWCATN